MHDFRKLKVWARARDVVVITDRMTRQFPRADHGVIAAQIRRAVISIPANIAEGCGRLGNSELHRFLQIACGSANELEYHFLLARDLGYISASDHAALEKQLLEMK